MAVVLMAIAGGAYAADFSDLQTLKAGNIPSFMESRIPVPVAGIARTYKAEPNRLYNAGTPFLYAPNEPFVEDVYTYVGCMADEAKAQAELSSIVAGLKEANFPLLQSGVNKSTECIDYTVRYTSNLDLNRFTYDGWLPDQRTAKAEMLVAVNKLKKAGIPLILQASVNEEKEGIGYTINFLANATLKKYEYVGFFATRDEAVKEMSKAVASLDSASLPVLQATVRTSKDGSDYLLRYAVPKETRPDTVVLNDFSTSRPTTHTGCQVKNQSAIIDYEACRTSGGRWRCYADTVINGTPSLVYGGCYASISACWSNGEGAVNPCH